MAIIKLTLRSFDSMEDATRIADEIRDAGAVSYENDSDEPARLEVSDVTVEAQAEA